MQVIFLEQLRLVREHRLDERHRDLHGFLHHVAQVPSDQNLAIALGEQRLDIENVAACLRPRQPRDDAGTLLLQCHIVTDRLRVQELAHVLRLHGDLSLFTTRQLDRDRAAERIQPFLQAPDTCLHCEIRDDLFHSVIGDDKLVVGNTGRIHRLGQQMTGRNLLFISCRIARKTDDLHAV